MKNRLSLIIIFIVLCILAFCGSLKPIFAVSPTKITLESALQTAMQENPALKVLHEKAKVAQAQLVGIALLSNPRIRNRIDRGYTPRTDHRTDQIL